MTESEINISELNASDIHEYAKRLIELHGDKAEAHAASRMQMFEQRSNREQADIWRRIRMVIHELRPAHQS